MNSFYASVECVERGLDPMTTNLVVADQRRTEKTICLAVSPSLKAYGIAGRARLFEVVERVREVCRNYLQAEKLLPIAKQEIAKAQAEADHEKEIAALKAKIDSLSAHLDQVYLDKLSGLLDEADFQRVYRKVKADRAALEQRLTQIDRPDFSPEKQNDLAKELVERFLAAAPTNREVLVSLIERVELTEEKEVILRFRFRELEQKG